MLSQPYRNRIERARRLLRASGIEALFVGPSADFHYLTGQVLTPRPRPLMLVLTGTRVGLLCPRLEAGSMARALPGIPIWEWSDGDDPLALLRSRLGKLKRFAMAPTLRADWVLGVAESRPTPLLGSGAPLLAHLRERKDPAELRALKAAALQADRVMGEARAKLKPGVSEESVARFIEQRFTDLGATNPWALVASGPNGALPHHHFSSRRLGRKDVIIVDLGAQLNGYQSDITRSFFLGKPSAEALRVYAVVLQAQSAGRATVSASTSGADADRAARAVIEGHGYGEYFIHRLGHGLGLETHEPPYLHRGNPDLLPEGAVVTVEPGIYLPGKFGIRLEDVVVVGSRGARTLTTYPLDRHQLR